MRTRIPIVAAMLAAMLLLTACGKKTENVSPKAQPVNLALDFYVNPDHVGIYEALAKGYFKQAGLEVAPQVPANAADPIKEVAAGRADLAISYEPELLIARDQGLDVVSVAALTQGPLDTLISLPSKKIATVADLRGKKVATAGISYQAKLLEAILKAAGLQLSDVNLINANLNLLPAILSDKIDALFGGFRNVEAVDLQARGKNPRVVPVEQLGVPPYDELVLVANGDRLRKDPKPVQLFIAALARGTSDAIADPKGATAALVAAGQGLDPKLTAKEVTATLPFLKPQDPAKPFGYMDAKQWATFAGWMRDNGLINDLPKTSDVLTTKYLPGEIP